MTEKAHASAGGMTADAGSRAKAGRYIWICTLSASAVFAVWVLSAFHDRFWWPPDEGAYAHVAERILQGDILNRDIQDIHAGYVNFANALAFRLFGVDLVSLRYPLAALAFISSGLVFFLLAPRGPVVAASGAAAMTALSFVQFLNPTAHWYALFLAVLLTAVLAWIPRTNRWRLPLLGFLIVTMVLFRQLSGVLMAIGAVTYLLAEDAQSSPAGAGGDRLLARTVSSVMGVGLLGYLTGRTDPFALLLFGAAPLALIIWTWRNAAATNRDTLRMIGWLSAGGLAALIPLVAYHAVHGSLLDWIDDTILTAFRLTGLTFFEHARYGYLKQLALLAPKILAPTDPAAALNGLFWITILLLAPANGFLIWRRMASAQLSGALHPVVFLAAFYGLVAVHYQIPIYLLYSASTSLIGLMWLTTSDGTRARIAVAGLTLFLCAVGLHYQAAQPLGRGLAGIFSGTRSAPSDRPALDKASLRITPRDAATYRELIRFIRTRTPAHGAILALPFNPELYFLSGRRNPVRFFNSALGLQSEDDLLALLRTLKSDPPTLVFYRPTDKYNTRLSARAMAFVRAHYDPLKPRGGFEIYRARSRSPKNPL